MPQGLNLLIIAAFIALVVILGLGLLNMFRGGDSNRSQKLMRLRVIVQFIALVLIMSALFFFSPKG